MPMAAPMNPFIHCISASVHVNANERKCTQFINIDDFSFKLNALSRPFLTRKV